MFTFQLQLVLQDLVLVMAILLYMDFSLGQPTKPLFREWFRGSKTN